MARKHTSTPASERFGVEAELERMLRCPECGSSRVRPNRSVITGGYGFFGFKAIGELSSPRNVECRSCDAQWVRPPMKEMRLEAERRIDERYDQFDAENQRLLEELERDRLTHFGAREEAEAADAGQVAGAGLGSIDVTPDGRSGEEAAN